MAKRDTPDDEDLVGGAATSDGKPRSNSGNVAKDQLLSIIERIERLEEEKKATMDDIKEVFAEAKGNGFDTKVLRKVIAIRKQDAAEREESEAILELYLSALGMPT